MPAPSINIEAGGRTVTVTNPDKVYFPEKGYTKLDIVRYYQTVAEGALRGVRGRPMVLKRFVNGISEEPFFQKRAPANHPEWMHTARVTFPSGRWADLAVCDEPADLLWCVNLGCVDLNPWPVRDADVDHPDELRVDLDPMPEVGFAEVKLVAMAVHEVLEELGYRGYPKTSGSRGIHVNVRIEPKWEFPQVRRAAIALSREVERRIPALATTAWWKEERHGVFLDYNQNARDRTVASAYSIRPTPDARVSCPLEWSEVPDCELADFTIETVPRRFKEIGDPHETIDDVRFSLKPLLELVERHEREGLGDAPWPPQFPKAVGEPKRVQPSRAKKPAGESKAPEAKPKPKPGVTRRQTVHPLITISKAQHKADALAGLERWKQKHPAAASFLETEDVLVDSMRGSSSTWTRIRVNLRNVPEADRPAEADPDPDYNPWEGMEVPDGRTAPLTQTKRLNPEDGRIMPQRRSRRTSKAPEAVEGDTSVSE